MQKDKGKGRDDKPSKGFEALKEVRNEMRRNAAPQQTYVELPTAVRTSELKDSVEVHMSHAVIDLNHPQQRAWLIRHLHWARHNKKMVSIYPTTDAITWVNKPEDSATPEK